MTGVFAITFPLPTVVWTLLAICGLTLGIMNLQAAREDLRAINILLDHPELTPKGVTPMVEGGPRHTIARSFVVSEGIRVIIQSLFLLIGVLGIFVNLPKEVLEFQRHFHAPWQVRLFTDTFEVSLILASGLLVIQSLIARLTRLQIEGVRT